jgi:glycosyltransferase involved in cell wall biosynthesis
MRVLMVHNRYLLRGGEDESTDAEAALLETGGVEVDRLILDNKHIDGSRPLRNGLRTIWSGPTYANVRERIGFVQPDIVHIQNFFPLVSPSAHWAAQAEGIPVVQALRNYRLYCLNGWVFRDGQGCELCHGKLPWRGVVHACYRDSRLGSSAVAAMLIAHRVARTWHTKVDLFIAPSEHARRKLAGSVPVDRVAIKPNFVPDRGMGTGRGGFALFAGRLSPEKGVATLLRAWRDGAGQLPELRIAGDGPLARTVAEAATQVPGVTYLGRKSLDEVLDLMAEAGVLVYPSEWPETFGRSVVEALSVGTPVLCSTGGAHSELVSDGIDGALFAPGDADGLRAAVTQLMADRQRHGAMREAARRTYLGAYTPARNLEALLRLYTRAREEHARRAQPSHR